MACDLCHDDGTFRTLISTGGSGTAIVICTCDLGERIRVALKLIAHGDTTLVQGGGPDTEDQSEEKINEAISKEIAERRRTETIEEKDKTPADEEEG